MPEITEFYRCFGCGREHESHGDAVSCCNVVQHVWRCECGKEFASERAAVKHAQKINHDLLQLSKSIEARPKPQFGGYLNRDLHKGIY